MACEITHRVTCQQIRFTHRDAAERYAEIMGGGVHNWIFTTVPDTNTPVGSTTGSTERTPATHQ
ncbi:hypothetical protein [Saccharomonospora glauca]|uniref:Uncharacterized protein n=1 Tax=Saccharomonospora glauca K62 TaxID=928724 RepID=I1CWP4_9PSEU|nr:hypothetical protein [Saccharomonospora glauca]EIE97118.1 hypothetical protein SacglDRAFT_00155 [Saccharomonospora glauca K62]